MAHLPRIYCTMAMEVMDVRVSVGYGDEDNTCKTQQVRTDGRGKRLVTICAELGGPNEFMTITMSVPNDGGDSDVRESGIARAKDFAKQFGDVPLQSFPADPLR